MAKGLGQSGPVFGLHWELSRQPKVQMSQTTRVVVPFVRRGRVVEVGGKGSVGV